MGWKEDQEFERDWWGDCSNTFTEEIKQLSYAYKMGLIVSSVGGKWPCYDLQGKNVIDIGGGPVSMLLKSENKGPLCRVVDPCNYPAWVRHRYETVGVGYFQVAGEEIKYDALWDEAWIYNVLQHTMDPELIIKNALSIAPVVRLFEWIDLPAHEGHPQELKADKLDLWLGGTGTVEWLNENNCYGQSYYGVFNRK
jgi:hypothetical protein